MHIQRPDIITFQPQPGFPNEDIAPHNATMAEYYLRATRDSESYKRTHLESLQTLHDVGNSALIAAQIDPGNNRAEYEAFCHGFTTIDYLATLVDSRPFAQFQNGTGMQHFYLDPGEMADFDLWQRREHWMQSHPNTLQLLRTTARAHHNTPKRAAAAAMGAQTASDLHYFAN